MTRLTAAALAAALLVPACIFDKGDYEGGGRLDTGASSGQGETLGPGGGGEGEDDGGDPFEEVGPVDSGAPDALAGDAT